MPSYVLVCLEAGEVGSVAQIGALSNFGKGTVSSKTGRYYSDPVFLRKIVKVAKLRRYRARFLALPDEV
jgi:hypothetical protein